MLKKPSNPWIARLMALGLVTLLEGASRGQEDDAPPSSQRPQGTFLGRFFSPPTSRKVDLPAPREGASNGGLLMPLKSFSNPFKPRNSADRGWEQGERSLPKPPREPFQDVETTVEPMTTDAVDTQEPRTNEEATEPESTKTSGNTAGTSNHPVGSGSASTRNGRQNPIETSRPNGPAKLSFSGTEDATAPSTEGTRGGSATPPAFVGGKTYEANPKKESIDSRGTTRRTSTRGSTVPPTANAADSRTARNDTESDAASSNVDTTPNGTSETKPITKPTGQEPRDVAAPPVQTRSSGNQVTARSYGMGQAGRSESKRAPSSETKRIPGKAVASRSGSIDTHVRSTPTIVAEQALETQATGLRLKLVGPESLQVGQSTPYEVIAINDGASSVQGLTVRILVPSSVQVSDVVATEGKVDTIAEAQGIGMAWEIPRLPAGTSKTLRMAIRTEQPEHFAMSMDWVLEHPLVQMPVRVLQPQLVLALEGPSEVDYGTPQTYRVRVRNPGNAPVANVRVDMDAAPFGTNQSELGDIPAGGERVVEMEVTFQQAGKLPIHAKAISEASRLDSSGSIDVDVRHSQLAANWNGPSEFYQGNTADYVLSLHNRGTIASANNRCRVQLPAGADVVQKPKGVSQTGDVLTWDIPSIASGETIDFAFQFAMNQLGNNGFVCDVESKTGAPTTIAMNTVVDAIADLQLTVNDPVAPAPIGKPVQYEITITNRGKKGAADVFAIAQFSEGIEPTKIDGHTGKLIPGQAIFDSIPMIGPGESITLRITAEASKPGMHRFRAAVRCQGTEDDLLKEESTRYTASGAARSESK